AVTISSANVVRRSPRRSTRATRWPLDAKTRASSVPIPADAPVISVTRSVMHSLRLFRCLVVSRPWENALKPDLFPLAYVLVDDNPAGSGATHGMAEEIWDLSRRTGRNDRQGRQSVSAFTNEMHIRQS